MSERGPHPVSRRLPKKGLIQVQVELNPEESGTMGETLWAYPIGGNYAQIASIPFFATEIGLDDVVETEISGAEVREYVAVVKKNTNTWFCTYEASTIEEFGKIVEFFAKYGLRVDSAVKGVFAVAVPTYWEQEQVRDVIKQCPQVVNVMEQ